MKLQSAGCSGSHFEQAAEARSSFQALSAVTFVWDEILRGHPKDGTEARKNRDVVTLFCRCMQAAERDAPLAILPPTTFADCSSLMEAAKKRDSWESHPAGGKPAPGRENSVFGYITGSTQPPRTIAGLGRTKTGISKTKRRKGRRKRKVANMPGRDRCCLGSTQQTSRQHQR
jgi:hypothetical protein